MTTGTHISFSAEQQQRIKDAVAAVEAHTSGEIVALILPRADDYHASAVTAAAMSAMAVATGALWWWPQLEYWAVALLLLGGYAAVMAVLKLIPALHRAVISSAEMEARVEQQTYALFTRHGLHRTRDATGILLLVCLFERRVRVLADDGISAVVKQQQWQQIVDTITAGLRSGDACTALCHAIEQCGELLIPHFPPRADDVDELPNLIME